MKRKSIVVTVALIASSHPIGKAEVAYCISPIEEREAMMMMIVIGNIRRFPSCQ